MALQKYNQIVDICVRLLNGEHEPRRRDIDEDLEIVWNEDTNICEITNDDQEEIVVPHCVGCARDPVAELNQWHERADLEIQAMHPADAQDVVKTELSTSTGLGSEVDTKPIGDSIKVDIENNGTPRDQEQEQREERRSSNSNEPKEQIGDGPIRLVVESVPRSPNEDGFFSAPTRASINPKEEKKRLVKMGLSTALAICLHNFPEGLATFVAALDDPGVGAVLAIAIGIHNIPEGLCVALPIYYATGNRWKAFLWGCLSGLSEPIAALLGWLVLANVITDDAYGILFGLVSGMMVMISLKELIPTAHRYDPEDTVVTYSMIVGMAVMGLSLVLFNSTR